MASMASLFAGRSKKSGPPPVVNPLLLVQNKPQEINFNDKLLLTVENIKRREKLSDLHIISTSLGYMSTENILALSVVECSRDCTSKNKEDIPLGDLTNTQNDRRMGTTSSKELCSTCTREAMECPGHLGRIKLNRSFVHPFALDAVKYILQSVCNSCGRMYLEKQILQELGVLDLIGINRLKEIAKYSTSKHVPCPNSNNPNHNGKLCQANPKYSLVDKEKEHGWDIHCEYVDANGIKNITVIEPDSVKKILLSIIPEDSLLLGFTGKVKPIDFIMEYLPVIPENNRPTIIRENMPHYDHLTLQYGKIINTNNNILAIKNKIPFNNNDYTKAITSLYFYIIHMFDNSKNEHKDTIRNDEPLLSIKERLSNKDGFLRGHAMGKRDNYNGRTVLGPANIDYGWTRYPQAMDVLTVPEKVHSRNRDFIRELYDQGKIVSIIKADGPKKGVLLRVSEAKKEAEKSNVVFVPDIGDIVNRKGLDGDQTIVNRQPSLHKYSMLGQKAKYTPELTIGIHSSLTTPLNADFDGDEGNTHKPQTIDARAEVKYVISSERLFMSDQSSRPIAGLVYSCLVSGDLISQPDVFFTEKQWRSGLKCLKNPDRLYTDKFYQRLKRYGIQKLTGKAIFSTLFPNTFYYDDPDKGVKFKEGIFISGVLGKKHLGPSTNGIIQSLFKTYSRERVVQFYTEGQYLLDWFIELRGFSIGIGDCIPKTVEKEKELVSEINREIVTTEAKIQQLGPEKEHMTYLEKEIREKKIQNYLGGMTRIGQNLGKKVLDKNNPLNVMSRSGAKGNAVNTAQITGVVGQQFIKGRRPELDMSGGTRCLSYYPPNSTSIFARGYVKNSFNKGLEPGEMFFHLAASRIGMMDTALQTALSGYNHHRINKALEDLKIGYDGSVISGNSNIFQFVYADGYGAEHLVSTTSAGTGTVLSPINFTEVIGALNLEADNEDLEEETEEQEEIIFSEEEDEEELELFVNPI